MAGPVTCALVPAPLSPEAWAPFGVLPTDESATATPARLEFRWDDGWVNFIGHTWDEAAHAPSGALVCDHLNRHDTHTQTLMPVDGDAVVVVAPPDAALAEPAELDQVRAFVVRRLECVHLHRGTWHWGPFPVAPGAVRLLNVQGSGYPRDNTVARLDALGTVFELTGLDGALDASAPAV